MSDFSTWFARGTGLPGPHRWQGELAADPQCQSRLIRVPTGLGKTLGVLAAWLYNRVVRNDGTWPRRLVWCLPMRVLVEQTDAEARRLLEAMGLLWDGQSDPHAGKVGVHLLMGGAEAGEWALYPEECAILIGTQDMLLSRALNRGYAAPRARWPMEFGLLNSDCLWVMDEVQLMDVGLATSAQLQAFRQDDRGKAMRPCETWWMSATLRPKWLESVDTVGMLSTARDAQVCIAAEHRDGSQWSAAKSLTIMDSVPDVKAWARLVCDQHGRAKPGRYGRITLVVVNTVKTACGLHDAIVGELAKGATAPTDLRLVHSRFRSHERVGWRETFLSRSACSSSTDRIIIATQVVEAGVDISATTIVTEIAPWPSLIQRFGRAARYGGSAAVTVVDRRPKDDRAAAPYAKDDIDAAREALRLLPDASLGSLEGFEERHPELLSRLYRYAPLHLLLRRELDELFATTPDLTGADLDISRFIRSGEERDVLVFWRDVTSRERPGADTVASREELCPVAFLDALKWLFDGDGKAGRAWVWDYLDGTWRSCRRDDVWPGQTILVEAAVGGYDAERGWTGARADRPGMITAPPLPSATGCADSAQDCEDLSQSPWKTIVTHGRETDAEVTGLAAALELPEPAVRVLRLAARWHDIGKAHPAFAACIKRDALGRPSRTDLAKAPAVAWHQPSELYRIGDGDRRPGFRHELASAITLFAVLQRHAPQHDALLGPFSGLLTLLGQLPSHAESVTAPTLAEQEVLALDRASFDLLAYLTCAHHGKVRDAWSASPQDQEYRDLDGHGMPIRGVRAGDLLPAVPFADSAGTRCELPAAEMHLEPAAMGLSLRTGPSWAERVARLIEVQGPFSLAWLEAVLRAADIRASRLATRDPLIHDGGVA